MTYPRSHLVDENNRGIYHVQSRCVRRSWLCGFDAATGRDFSHRRAWIEKRIVQLAQYFSISIYGYAVMSNHYHIVLETLPEICRTWSTEEVVERWLAICPGPQSLPREDPRYEIRKRTLLADSARVETLRRRLGSLSWFMRFLNEPLARMANREDDCSGRFWQGRFESQRLLDEGAVLAAMVYVDLNPVRAGIAVNLEDCEFTSVHARLNRQTAVSPLAPLNPGAPELSISPITLSEYLSLVRWTARHQSRVRPAGNLSHPCLTGRAIDCDQWFLRYLPRPGCRRRAVGSIQSLRDYAAQIGQRWIQMSRTPVTPKPLAT